MLEPYEPVNPPEIRVPSDTYRVVEFYVHLGDPRPEVMLFEMIAQWLGTEPPYNIHGVQISYHRRNDEEPDFMCGLLLLGAPLDIG